MGKTKCCKFERNFDTGGGGGGSCFPAGVLILMANGSYKPIEEIRPDDYVMSYDFENKKLSVSKVLAIESPLRDNVCVVRFNDTSFLNLTWDHPVFTLEGIKSIKPEFSSEKEKLNLTELKIGDVVYALNSSTNKLYNKKVVSIICERGLFQTYNPLNITPHSNYFAENVLVHNDKCGR